jgi:DMSO/TMAO reductase YedYZ heme-binding membrane subunit
MCRTYGALPLTDLHTQRYRAGLQCLAPPALLGYHASENPDLTVGFTGFVLMIPLAVTSTAGMVRRLGFRKCQMLHR